MKLYLRVDFEYDDILLLELIATAKDYMFESTGGAFTGTPMEKLCINLLVAHWYEDQNKDAKDFPYRIQSLLTHIEYK